MPIETERERRANLTDASRLWLADELEHLVSVYFADAQSDKGREAWNLLAELMTETGHAVAAALRQSTADTGTAEREAGAADGWLPIETAPRDGTAFLAAHEGSGAQQVSWYGKASHVPIYGWCALEAVGDEEVDLWRPTHWRPLPDPPGSLPLHPEPEAETAKKETNVR